MTRRAADPKLLPLLLALSCLAAGSALAKSSDRNQRTNVGADSSDCSINEGGPCILTGNVSIKQGSMDITAARADVRRSGGEIRSVKLDGAPVKLRQQMDDGAWLNATAAQVDYDLGNSIVIFTGSANIQQPGRGSISGERIVYNMRTGQVQSGGAAGSGRVNMTFEPKDKAPASAPDKTKPADKPAGKPADSP